MTQDFDAIVPAPFGAVGLKVEDDFLVHLALLAEPLPEKINTDPFVQHAVHQVREYLANPASPLDISCAVKGTSFQKRVWQAVAAIPAGKTLSYSALAAQVGSGPRAVANVCGANQVPLFIPCHRVVAKKGIGGFMQGNTRGLTIKKWLLAHEQAVYER